MNTINDIDPKDRGQPQEQEDDRLPEEVTEGRQGIARLGPMLDQAFRDQEETEDGQESG